MIPMCAGAATMSNDQKKSSDNETTGKTFAQLAQLVSEAGIRLRPEDRPLQKPHAEVADSSANRQAPEDPGQVFADAMAGVPRIEWRHGPAPSASSPAPPGSPDPEVLDERLFHDAVEGDAAPPILEHPEYIEGWIGVAGQRFLPQLRTGVYSIQGAVDLHGFSRNEAREAVEGFILRMSRERS
jgi:hypothetical protein